MRYSSSCTNCLLKVQYKPYMAKHTCNRYVRRYVKHNYKGILATIEAIYLLLVTTVATKSDSYIKNSGSLYSCILSCS